MCQSSAGEQRVQKWYSRNIFPLIPILEVKKSDEYNTSGFTFRWLFITLWSLDNIDFEISFVITSHWGIGFIGILPYLRWVLAIPCPEKLGIWIDKKFNRGRNLYKGF